MSRIYRQLPAKGCALGWEHAIALRFQPDSRLEQVRFIVGNFSAHCARRRVTDVYGWADLLERCDNTGLGAARHRPFGHEGSKPVLITFRIKGWHLIAIAVHGRIVGIARIIADAARIIRTV